MFLGFVTRQTYDVSDVTTLPCETDAMRLTALLTTLAILCACEPAAKPEPTKPAKAKPTQTAPRAAKPPAPVAKPAPAAKPKPLRLDFNELATTAYERETMKPGKEADIDALWNAAFHLRAWNILGDPKSTRVPPDLIFEDRLGKKWLMAFTNNQRLHDYAKATKRLDTKGTSVFLTMPNPQISGFLTAMSRRGVHGVWFNEGPFSWAASIPDIQASVARLREQGAL